MDVLAHLLRWKPHVELVRGPCRHVGSMAGLRTGFKTRGSFGYLERDPRRQL
jgi:hypothetical protein